MWTIWVVGSHALSILCYPHSKVMCALFHQPFLRLTLVYFLTDFFSNWASVEFTAGCLFMQCVHVLRFLRLDVDESSKSGARMWVQRVVNSSWSPAPNKRYDSTAAVTRIFLASQVSTNLVQTVLGFSSLTNEAGRRQKIFPCGRPGKWSY